MYLINQIKRNVYMLFTQPACDNNEYNVSIILLKIDIQSEHILKILFINY